MNPEQEPILKQAEIKSVTSQKVTKANDPAQTGWKEHLLSVEATIDFDLWFSECESWIMPDGEYETVDDSNEMHFWMDDFYNVHWLVKTSTGHIQEKVVDISGKLQELADEKYQEHLHDLELENDKF